MYLSRLFILFHFNIAIDVIAAVGIRLLLVSFSPLRMFQFMRNWCWCASVRDVKVMLLQKFSSSVSSTFFFSFLHSKTSWNSPSAYKHANVPFLIRWWHSIYRDEIAMPYIHTDTMHWRKMIQIWIFVFEMLYI